MGLGVGMEIGRGEWKMALKRVPGMIQLPLTLIFSSFLLLIIETIDIQYGQSEKHENSLLEIYRHI